MLNRFTPLFLLLLALNLLPLWLVTYLPMVDLPQHLAMIRIFSHLEDPSLPFHEWFTVRPGFTPYLGYYWAVRLLALLMPVDTASRLFLTICLAALPVGVVLLARAFGRSEWLALFALPLTYTFEFYFGFISYLASLVLMIFSLAAYGAHLRGGLKGSGWDAILVLLPVACLASHPQPYLFFVASLAVMTAARSGHRLAAVARAGPSLVLLLFWLRALVASQQGAPGLRSATYTPLRSRLESVNEWVLDQFHGPVDSLLLLGFALLWGWAIALASRPGRTVERAGDRWAPALLAGGAIGGYFLMPTHAPLMQFIHPRYAALGCLLLALAVPLKAGAVLPQAWRASLAGLCACCAIYLCVQFHRFDTEAGDFRALARSVEPASCVGTLGGYMPIGVMRDSGAYNHFAGYLTLWRDAISGYTFAGTHHSPVAYRRRDGFPAAGYADAELPVIMEPAAGRHVSRGTTYAAYGSFYRYFLLPAGRDPADFFDGDAGRLVRLGASGPLALYLNPGGNCGK